MERYIAIESELSARSLVGDKEYGGCVDVVLYEDAIAHGEAEYQRGREDEWATNGECCGSCPTGQPCALMVARSAMKARSSRITEADLAAHAVEAGLGPSEREQALRDARAAVAAMRGFDTGVGLNGDAVYVIYVLAAIDALIEGGE